MTDSRPLPRGPAPGAAAENEAEASAILTIDLDALSEALEPLVRDGPACEGFAGSARGSRWVEPLHVCEVRYAEITDDGLLRQPAFLRLRPDKAPEECDLPRRRSASEAVPMEARVAPAAGAEREVALTNLDKLFWPAQGYTKGDFIEYHHLDPWAGRSGLTAADYPPST